MLGNVKGKVSIWLIALGSILAGLILLAVIAFSAIVGFNNQSVTLENSIKAQYEQNKNNYDNYFKKLLEATQVTDMYASDFKKIYDGVMQGRYGNEGSKAVMQWITENNPTLDSAVYTKIQQIIEAGRNSFEADQKTLIDKKMVYENHLAVFPNSLLASFMGFPKIDLAKYSIITSDETEKAFESKKSEPIQLRK